jgi:ribose transport system substrate-binding protein
MILGLPLFWFAFWLLFWLWPGLLLAEGFRIGFAQDTLANDWRRAQVMEVRLELEKHPGVEFIYTDAEGDTALQALHIEELVRQGVDLLITSPRDQDLLAEVIAGVRAQGIPVVLLSRGIATDDYDCYIHPDNSAIARAAAEYLVDKLGGKGHILMLQGIPEAMPTVLRTQAFLQVTDAYPEIKITRRVANYLRADAILAVEELLASGERFDAIYAQSDSMAAGARMALKYQGLAPGSLYIVGIDYVPEARQAILAGEQSLSFTYPTGGREGARMALRLLRGERPPKELILESVPVTRDNAAQVEPVF